LSITFEREHFAKLNAMKYLLVVFVSFASLSFAQTLNVFAASSLSDAFEKIATVFEAENPGTDITFNFAGSSTLAAQISQGAPADVFASADLAQMQVVVDAGLVRAEPSIFTRNRLVVITPSGSEIEGLEDLAKPGVLLVLAEGNVPIGRYSREVLENLNETYGPDFSENVLANLVSEEPNVRQVATKVELGEADAAITYVTDAALLSNVRTVDIPDDANVIATYPVATLAAARNPTLAQRFVDFVLSDKGQTLLGEYGFLPAE
jgi:molybdate transport system substrate-binding protein